GYAAGCLDAGQLRLETPMTRIIRWCAVLALVLPTAGYAQDKKEPEFGGIPLSKWVEQLKSPDAEKRKDAAWAIARIGPAARDAVPALIETLKDEDAHVRWSAAVALAQITPAAKDAVPVLIESLKDKEFAIRYRAVVGLGKIGPDAKAAVPALIEALKDEESAIREAAGDSL
ncbi:MAG TPA: HEAT repeat domain-containing protein, partial [Gemmataceae bacterium]|nr:HEAT repeat domain-containing protein [Gemmataceae bacterium]